MFLNRITFDAGFEPTLVSPERRNFNRLTSFFEDVLFHYLPRKVNAGGFGYLQIILDSRNATNDHVTSGGQFVNVTILHTPVDWDLFKDSELHAGFLYLVDMLEVAVGEINQSMEIDKHAFDTVIAVCRTAKWPIQFEQVLKVSRTHPSRKVKVEIYREVALFEERIGYRILGGKRALIETGFLSESASVYHAAYDFRKSFWEDNKLIILDRFDERKYQLDIDRYIY